MNVSGSLQGVDEALRDLASAAKDGAAATRRALTRILFLAQREARDYAPRSPSQKILRALRKTKRRVKRKDRATHRASPGGLERSIKVTIEDVGAVSLVRDLNGVIFVEANSEAGKYAGRIHDEKGLTWHNRGPGTVQKGDQADHKFIERAVLNNEDQFMDIILDEHRKAVPT